jgi:S-DNA-T family DNA segregation ATPase FtsK/SpoIIIE
VIATIMANPMFMLFAAMGAIAAVATFIVGAVTTRRKRLRLRAEHAARIDDFGAAVDALGASRRVHHRVVYRTVADTLDEAFAGGARLWQRRLAHRSDVEAGTATPTHGEAILSAVVGTGVHRWSPPIEIPDRQALDGTLLQRVEQCARLDAVAAPLSIRPGDAIAFHGARHHSSSIARSVLSQLATWVGPADWQLVVVSSDRRTWRWVDWLPHGALDHGALVHLDGPEQVDELGDALDAIDSSRHTVLVTDEPHLFAARTGPLRRFLSASHAAALVVVDTDATVPAMCRRVLTVGSTGSASWSGDVPDADDAVSIAFTGISVDTADRVARRLACLVDPEDDGGASGGLPTMVSFGELVPDTSVDAIVERWRSGGTDPAPAAPLGASVDGRIDIDLVRDGPHGLIAGTTGAGKSELLRTLVLSLAAAVGPEHLNFVLVDYKGGSTFDACTGLPHTVGLVTDLDDGLAERALVSLDAELHRRERLLRSVGAADLADYRARQATSDGGSPPIARLVVVIDEFAALAKELPEFLNALVGIAQRGRSLGVHLLLATQRPAGVVNDDIRANTNLRLALRLHDKPDAVDVVGDELPAKFPRGVPGRSALRLGPDELVVFQAARCTGPALAGASDGIIVDRQDRPTTRFGSRAGPGTAGALADAEGDPRSELETTVEAIIEAAAALGVDAPHRPWVEPLPFPLPPEPTGAGDGLGVSGDDADAFSIGVVDDPQHQRRRPLAWRPADGSLALIGSIGSGTTSTMIALAAATCRRARPDDLHLYVVDARGDDGLAALATIAHCGGVVRLTEDERLHRLFARVVDAIDRRLGLGGGAADDEPDLVLMIDGYGSLRSSLGSIEQQATFDLLQRIVTDGPAVGVALVLADEGGTAITMVPVAHRWLFRLDDPSVARSLGLRTPPAGPGRPGRMRILTNGLEAQVAQGAAGLAALPARGDRDAGGPAAIAALPDLVGVDDIGRSPDCPSGVARLAIGVDGADLGTAVLDLVDGDHALVVGGPRTGVSTTLARLAAAWEQDATRRGVLFRVVSFGRRMPVDPEVVVDPTVRMAIVIDDAHRVDDPGVLADIAHGEYPHVTVLAGARADVVRTSYGHWTREMAKSRCGIVMASRSDPDGDLLSAHIPRRSLVPARPGLAWIVDGGPLRQVQVAVG